MLLVKHTTASSTRSSASSFEDKVDTYFSRSVIDLLKKCEPLICLFPLPMNFLTFLTFESTADEKLSIADEKLSVAALRIPSTECIVARATFLKLCSFSMTAFSIEGRSTDGESVITSLVPRVPKIANLIIDQGHSS